MNEYVSPNYRFSAMIFATYSVLYVQIQAQVKRRKSSETNSLVFTTALLAGERVICVSSQTLVSILYRVLPTKNNQIC